MLKRKINFRIVEGEQEDGIDFNQLKKDYLDEDISVGEMVRKHGLSRKRYYKYYHKRLVKETGYDIKPNKMCKNSQINKVLKYITQDPLTGTYRVAKYVDGKLLHFGGYKTLEEAVRVRDVMADHNWDKEFYEKHIKPHYFTSYNLEDEDEVFAQYKEDYLNGMTIKELMEKYGISKYRYCMLSASINHEYGLSRKPVRVKI